MMLVPAGVKVHIALGVTDLRKGLDGLAMLVQEVLRQDPFSGHLFAFSYKTKRRTRGTDSAVPGAANLGPRDLEIRASSTWIA